MSNTISAIVRERRSDEMQLLMNFVCMLYLKYQSECDSFCENGGEDIYPRTVVQRRR
jgi:hypothetical protein